MGAATIAERRSRFRMPSFSREPQGSNSRADAPRYGLGAPVNVGTRYGLSDRVTFVLGRDRVEGAALADGGVSLADGAVVVGASLTAGGGTYVGVYVRLAVVVGTSTAVVDGGAGGATAIGATTGAGVSGGAGVVAGGYLSSGASVGAVRGYQMVTPTMAAVATVNTVMSSPRADM